MRSVTALLSALASAFVALTQTSTSSADEASNRPPDAASQPAAQISIFFGTNKVATVQELKREAVRALQAKGHQVPASAKCIVNGIVGGREPGCAVIFFDRPARMVYQVLFDERGDVRHVQAGPDRHGTPGPGDPKPEIPQNGVRVKP